MVSIVVKCCHSCRMRKSSQCPLVETIDLRVSICPDNCWHCWAGVAIHFILPSSSPEVPDVLCRPQSTAISSVSIHDCHPLLHLFILGGPGLIYTLHFQTTNPGHEHSCTRMSTSGPSLRHLQPYKHRALGPALSKVDLSTPQRTSPCSVLF